MAALANMFKSIKKPPRCKPSARVGNSAPEQRADVSHRLAFKPHNMSDRQWQALHENKRYNHEVYLEGMLAIQQRHMVEAAAAERRVRAVVHIQRAWRTVKFRKYWPVDPRLSYRQFGEQTDSDSSDSDSDDEEPVQMSMPFKMCHAGSYGPGSVKIYFDSVNPSLTDQKPIPYTQWAMELPGRGYGPDNIRVSEDGKALTRPEDGKALTRAVGPRTRLGRYPCYPHVFRFKTSREPFEGALRVCCTIAHVHGYAILREEGDTDRTIYLPHKVVQEFRTPSWESYGHMVPFYIGIEWD